MYLLEHLATFTVSPEMGTLGPRDGMRRLLQMEKTTGIWTQKMELRLRNQSVVIVDHENGVRMRATGRVSLVARYLRDNLTSEYGILVQHKANMEPSF